MNMAPDANPDSERTIRFGYSIEYQGFVAYRFRRLGLNEHWRMIYAWKDGGFGLSEEFMYKLRSWGTQLLPLHIDGAFPVQHYQQWFMLHDTSLVNGLLSQQSTLRADELATRIRRCLEEAETIGLIPTLPVENEAHDVVRAELPFLMGLKFVKETPVYTSTFHAAPRDVLPGFTIGMDFGAGQADLPPVSTWEDYDLAGASRIFKDALLGTPEEQEEEKPETDLDKAA